MKVKKIFDISRKVHTGMVVWPGDRNVEIERAASIGMGDICNLSEVSMSLHTGTHVDAPCHFIDKGKDIGSLDLDRFIGFAKVFELNAENCITEDCLKELSIDSGDIVLFKTSNSNIPQEGEFYKSYVYLNASAAKFLVDRQVKTVGVDYLSVDDFTPGSFDTHHILLGNSIGIAEGLCLKDVKPGTYFFSCLPLNIEGVDGSPARAVLIEFEI